MKPINRLIQIGILTCSGLVSIAIVIILLKLIRLLWN